MRRRPSSPLLLAAAAALLAAAGLAGSGARAADGFSQWLAELQAEAIRRGVSEATVRAALTDVEPLPEVIELDRKQPGKPAEFCDYLQRRLSAERIERGRRILREEAPLLERLTAEYGVPARYLVALWGLETNFGDYTGSFPVVTSLVTLAHDPRRSKLFREQVFAALHILDRGHRPANEFLGSWAGAMGQVQFMPTTFLEYAVDHDGDGRKDLWSNRGDALASAANYLRRSGWKRGQTWGRQVRVPRSLERDRARLKQRRSLASWQELGVRRSNGGHLPRASVRGRIVQPLRGPGPAFLAYPNYDVFLTWNRSTYFAVSVGTLADELAQVGTLDACGL